MKRGILTGVAGLCLLTAPLEAQVNNFKIQELRRRTSAIDMRVKAATAEVQQQANAVPEIKPTDVQIVPSPQNPTQQVEVVSEQQRQQLIEKVKEFAGEKKKSQSHFYGLALTLVIAGVGLALVAAVLGFVKMANAAGIVSLIVAAVVGVPKAYPVPALADFYNSLSVQALALETDCELKNPMTVDEYKASAAQLKALILYEAQNKPGFGATTTATDDLAKQLQELRTLASAKQ